MGVGDVLGMIFSGGATGLIGLGVNAVTAYKQNQEKNRHDEAMVGLNSEAMRAEAELELEKITVEGDIQQNIESTKAASAALQASYKHDQAAYFKGKQGPLAKFFFGFVDVWRGSIRPGMTTYLVVLTSLMFWEMMKLIEGLEAAFPADDATEIIRQIVSMVLYLTATCITWWFGGRQMEKSGLLSRN